MMSRSHCLLTNEFTLWDLKKWSLREPVASQMETVKISAKPSHANFCPFTLVFPSCFKIQFVCDKVVKLYVLNSSYFPVSCLYCFRSIFVFVEAFFCKPCLFIYERVEHFFGGCLWLQSEVACTYGYHSWC